MMLEPRAVLLFTPILLLASCGSAPSGPDQAIEEKFARSEQELEADQKRREAFELVLRDTDTLLERYAVARLDGAAKAERMSERLERMIVERVRAHFPQFLQAASNASIPRNRAISLAAIGLSGRDEALNPLLNGLAAEDPAAVSNAVLGLGLLADPRTPPKYLQRVVDSTARDDNTRACAAWSLLQVQGSTTDTEPIARIWREILDRPLQENVPGVLVSALRGIGLIANEIDAPRAERFLAHATPQVRQAAAIAVGRIGVQSSHTALLDLISPAELVPNVRLAARKALQALAGGVDRGYDVEEWQRVFDRG